MSDDFRKKTMPTINVPSDIPSYMNEDDITGQVDIPTMAVQLERAEQLKHPCLMVLAGMDMGNVMPIERDGFVVGRDPDCDLALQDDGISRQHVKIEKLSERSILVTDLDTTNGTYSGGELIKTAVLKPGQKILLGRNTVIKFVLQDAIDLKYQQEMFDSSTRDGLTGTYNRRYLIQKLISDLSFSRRHRIPFSLVIFDIDFFKRVNDTYGHPVGDQVLIAVANIVEQTIRTEDILGRYGGEEFAVIAQGTDFRGAKTLAERLRKAIADEPALAVAEGGQFVRVTISVGVATIAPGAIIDAPKLISITDANLYEAKNTGRNQTIASEVTSPELGGRPRRIPIPPKHQ